MPSESRPPDEVPERPHALHGDGRAVQLQEELLHLKSLGLPAAVLLVLERLIAKSHSTSSEWSSDTGFSTTASGRWPLAPPTDAGALSRSVRRRWRLALEPPQGTWF